MLKKLLITLALILTAASVSAADDAEKTVSDALHSLLPLVKIDHIAKSDLPGFHEVIVNGQVVYVSDDGKYLLQGNLFDVPQKKDLTAARISKLRAQAIAGLPDAKQMIFAPEHPKHTVTVFTDVDCPYCRQFHKQIDAYNAAGIAVKYVLFPLDIHPGADKKAVAVWCAQDRKATYTAAMNGVDPGSATCPNNPVSETKAFALSLGINATPSVIAEDGSRVDDGKASNPATLVAELDRIAAKVNKPVASR